MKQQNIKPDITNTRFFGSLMAGLLLFLVVLSSCAVQKADSAGMINGVNIPETSFLESYKGHFTGFVLEKDRRPDEKEKLELYQKTWTDITIHIILKEYFNKYNIKVTQSEVLDTLMTNIPASITKAPVFQTNGEFDKALYLKTLTSESNNTLDWLKGYYYEYYIPLAKLKTELQTREIISRQELTNLYNILNTEADIDWVVFDPRQTKVEISQAEIENYYHANSAKYAVSRYAGFGWVTIPVISTQADVGEAKAKADSIYYELGRGKSFASMVETFSAAPSAGKGGALGFVRYDELTPTLKTALEGIGTGNYTRPQKIDNYWVIYQLAERTKNMVKLNELAIAIAPGTASKTRIKDTAIHLRDLSLQLGLQTAAEEMDLAYNKTGKVTADSVWLQDADVCAYLIDRAYAQTKGAVLEPVYSQTMRAWIVAQVIELQPLERKPLVEVNDDIAAWLKSERQKSQTLDLASSWVAANITNLRQAAIRDGLEIVSTGNLNYDGEVKSIPVSSFFSDVISRYQNKKDQTVISAGDFVFYPLVTKTSKLSNPIIGQQEARNFYYNSIEPDWFNKWLDQRIKEARIKIWYDYSLNVR